MQIDEAKTDTTTDKAEVKLESTDAGENEAEINTESFVVQEKGDETDA